MAKPILPDERWEVIAPLIPERMPDPRGGRPPVGDREALTGILFVLKAGIPWEDWPCEMGYGSLGHALRATAAGLAGLKQSCARRGFGLRDCIRRADAA